MDRLSFDPDDSASTVEGFEPTITAAAPADDCVRFTVGAHRYEPPIPEQYNRDGDRICQVLGCSRLFEMHGRCVIHYKRLTRRKERR